MSEHGTTRRYQQGCRCAVCCEAKKKYYREYWRRTHPLPPGKERRVYPARVSAEKRAQMRQSEKERANLLKAAALIEEVAEPNSWLLYLVVALRYFVS